MNFICSIRKKLHTIFIISKENVTKANRDSYPDKQPNNHDFK